MILSALLENGMILASNNLFHFSLQLDLMYQLIPGIILLL
jgi:hypothetical protein